jgi:hypothetical protein
VGEAAKYLPKKAPFLPSPHPLRDPRRDLMMIRAASTLLQELWDGKLRATVKSFTKKVSAGMALRRRLEAAAAQEGAAVGGLSVSLSVKEAAIARARAAVDAAGAGAGVGAVLTVPPPPSWATWKDDSALSNTLTAQATRHAALDSIRTLETAVSAELRLLAELRVYPVAELSQIRKDVKAYRDNYDEASITDDGQLNVAATSLSRAASEEAISATAAELRLCERKLSILRSKRHDETDARNAALRKIQRQEQKAEQQRNDPINFAFNPLR